MRAKSLWPLLAFGLAVIAVTPAAMAADAGGKANYGGPGSFLSLRTSRTIFAVLIVSSE